MKESNDSYDVIIAGGGPAGSSAAIHLANFGARVLLVEQKKFPRAKLCGEFISPECLDHFVRLDVMKSIEAARGVTLTETVFYARSGRNVSIPSKWFGRGSVGALGLSRAEMDSRLLARAREAGAEVWEETQATNLVIDNGRVLGVHLRTGDSKTRIELAPVILDATGRARVLGRHLEKKDQSKSASLHRPARLIAFKAHLKDTRGVPEHCEIYVYRGGYGGLNSVENGLSNLCFIASAQIVKTFGGDAKKVMHEVVMQNRRAAQTLENATNVTPWLAVSLDSFGRQRLVPADGLLSVGDAASFIDPFTGSGMLMALESGELAARSVARYLSFKKDGSNFQTLADDYRRRYNEKFNSRLRVSAGLRQAAFIPRFADAMIFTIGASERVRRRLARATRTSSDDAMAGAG